MTVNKRLETLFKLLRDKRLIDKSGGFQYFGGVKLYIPETEVNNKRLLENKYFSFTFNKVEITHYAEGSFEIEARNKFFCEEDLNNWLRGVRRDIYRFKKSKKKSKR